MEGWNAASLLDHPQRLLTPPVRSVPADRTSPLRAAGWDGALALVVSGTTALPQVAPEDERAGRATDLELGSGCGGEGTFGRPTEASRLGA